MIINKGIKVLLKVLLGLSWYQKLMTCIETTSF